MNRERKGCDCHPWGMHYHDVPLSRAPEHSTYRVLDSGQSREVEHDKGVKALCWEVQKEIMRDGHRILALENENDIKRVISRIVGNRIIELHRTLNERELREIAEGQGLRFVDGSIRIPDARILVERNFGIREWCVLEHLSQHYRARAVSAKVAAGFRVSGGSKAMRRLLKGVGYTPRKVRDGPDIIGRLLG